MRQLAKRIVRRSVELAAQRGLVDLLDAYYATHGILQYQNSSVSGEDFLLRNVLAKYYAERTTVCFDVGANVGDYSQHLLAALPQPSVFAFEPSPAAFAKLAQRFAGNRSVVPVHSAMGEAHGWAELFDRKDATGSQHASLYAEVFRSAHRTEAGAPVRVEVDTVDRYCEQRGIGHIDLLKIDTEGHELSVLKGAKAMLSAGAIDFVQFEFNEMNVVSRVFLRDFYAMLEGYALYRLMRNGLLALGRYDARNEIFKFQNLVAVRNDCLENRAVTTSALA